LPIKDLRHTVDRLPAGVPSGLNLYFKIMFEGQTTKNPHMNPPDDEPKPETPA
jgi:hypothetical protein